MLFIAQLNFRSLLPGFAIFSFFFYFSIVFDDDILHRTMAPSILPNFLWIFQTDKTFQLSSTRFCYNCLIFAIFILGHRLWCTRSWLSFFFVSTFLFSMNFPQTCYETCIYILSSFYYLIESSFRLRSNDKKNWMNFFSPTVRRTISLVSIMNRSDGRIFFPPHRVWPGLFACFCIAAIS